MGLSVQQSQPEHQPTESLLPAELARAVELRQEADGSRPHVAARIKTRPDHPARRRRGRGCGFHVVRGVGLP